MPVSSPIPLSMPPARIAHILRESEEVLNAIFDASPDGVIISNADGVIVLVSRQVENLLGYPPAELLGHGIDILVPDSVRAHHPALRERFVASPSTRLMGKRREICARRRDGSEGLFEIGLSQVATSAGLMVATSLRDISERKQKELAAREQADKLRHLFELSPLGIALTDMEGHFLEINHAFCGITGYAEEELKVLDYWALTPATFARDEARQIELLAKTGRYGPYQKAYQRKDGSLVPVRLNGVQMTGQSGKHFIWSIVEDITDYQRNQEAIRHLAFFDQLTGLPNRTLLHDRLAQAIAASARSGDYGGVLLIDLDNFKALNDSRGHSVGDRLLVDVARILQSIVSQADTVARLGGDEFVIVLPSLCSSVHEATAKVRDTALNILAALRRYVPAGADTFRCCASLGATLFQGDSGGMEDILKQSELAMYRAKEGGRNTARFFDPAMEASVVARMALEADLRTAVEQQQFVLHYQVQVHQRHGCTGAEALIRWRHPLRGMVAPDEFIPVAEETGLILPIGLWVLDSACRQLKLWELSSVLAPLQIAVNVSASQFNQPNFVSEVNAIIDAHGIDPSRLKLELTESALMDDVVEAARKMASLRALGLQLSLDDFGTGYSSLAYLKSLPLDQLKIDQSFVRDVLNQSNDAAIVRTVIALARSLKLHVIAEGVETLAQQQFLAAAGCDAYQGYYYGRPVPVDQFEQARGNAAY